MRYIPLLFEGQFSHKNAISSPWLVYAMSSDENKNGYIMMMMAMDAYSNSGVCSIKLSK